MEITSLLRPKGPKKSSYARSLLAIGEGLLVGALFYGAFVFTITTGGLWDTSERLSIIFLAALLFIVGRGGFLVAIMQGLSPEQKRAKIRLWLWSVGGGILIGGSTIAIHFLVTEDSVLVLFFGLLSLGLILIVLGLWLYRISEISADSTES